jgi:hypothetical protein
MRNAYDLDGNDKGTRPLGDPRVKIILKWVSKNRLWNESVWLTIWTTGGLL